MKMNKLLICRGLMASINEAAVSSSQQSAVSSKQSDLAERHDGGAAHQPQQEPITASATIIRNRVK